MIVGTTREMPATWTDDLCVELLEHAHDLSLNGNPGGFILTVELCPFVGVDRGDRCVVKPQQEWDFDGMRQWIAENPEEVKTSWQRAVRPDW